jgi:maltose/moltooligosaccharide transporter
MNRPRRNTWQIFNMSFGFFGIQIGWNLQMANMSAIYEYLGAKADQIPILWLAAPLTGLLVQPIIGYASDHTWGPLGRRRPYFLAGAILSSLALIMMPQSSALWMAAGLLWVLDASINISMEPFRAFVADMLPDEQRTGGFAMQSLLIGLGAVLANLLPWLLSNHFHLRTEAAGAHAIPLAVRLSFYIGAAAFLSAVLWTVFTTPEYPPEDIEAFRRQKAEAARTGFFERIAHSLKEITTALLEMPVVMRDLALVQLPTWLGLFCMWLYFPVAVAHNVFGAVDQSSPQFTSGVEWAGLCFGLYSAVCFAFSFALPVLARRLGRRNTHSLCLGLGAAGLISVAFIHQPALLFVSMVGVGVAWASILSMPYAVLAASLPQERTGVYMGIFNFFIVLPEIVAALCFGPVMNHLLHNNRMAAVVAGGFFLLLAAALMQRVRSQGTA